MITIREILGALDEKGFVYEFKGDRDTDIDRFSSLRQYRKGSLTWIKSSKNLREWNGTDITCLVLQKGVDLPAENMILVENAKEVFFYILKTFWKRPGVLSEIGKGTIIGKNVILEKGVSVGYHCTLDGCIRIGEGTIIENHVTLVNDITIGRDCVIHSGAVIGTDGFGYVFDENKVPVKVEHFGGVTIGDRVEIGANSCIDRGTIDDTVIENDVKIDNLVHIAHNCQVGEGVLLVAGAVLCGSSAVGSCSYVAPGGIVKEQIRVGENSFIGMGAHANTDVEANTMLYERTTKRLKNKDYHGLL